MANIKQQIKRNKTNEIRHQRNVAFKSKVKTSMKKVEQAVKANDKKLALELLNLAYKDLDTANSKGLYHKNFVSRNKSRLAKDVASIK